MRILKFIIIIFILALASVVITHRLFALDNARIEKLDELLQDMKSPNITPVSILIPALFAETDLVFLGTAKVNDIENDAIICGVAVHDTKLTLFFINNSNMPITYSPFHERMKLMFYSKDGDGYMQNFSSNSNLNVLVNPKSAIWKKFTVSDQRLNSLLLQKGITFATVEDDNILPSVYNLHPIANPKSVINADGSITLRQQQQ